MVRCHFACVNGITHGYCPVVRCLCGGGAAAGCAGAGVVVELALVLSVPLVLLCCQVAWCLVLVLWC
jgi:hypothetical protein